MVDEQPPRGSLRENCDPVKESQLSSTSRIICHALGNSKNIAGSEVRSSSNLDLLDADVFGAHVTSSLGVLLAERVFDQRIFDLQLYLARQHIIRIPLAWSRAAEDHRHHASVPID